MLAAYPSGTINKSQIPFCCNATLPGYKTAVFGPLISSCSVSKGSRVHWSNVECYHSSFYPRGQIHHQRRWIFCRSRNNTVSPDDEYRSSRNIALSLLRRYRTVIERGEGETLKEFISAGVNAYALGCTDEDLRKELMAMEESGLEIERMESYHGSTQTKSKILLSEVDECILWLSIVFITILCTPQPTVVRWSSTPSVSDEILSKWRGFCAVIANAYYIRGMAWLPVKTLQLEQMAVTGQAEEPSVVASRMRLVFSTLEETQTQKVSQTHDSTRQGDSTVDSDADPLAQNKSFFNTHSETHIQVGAAVEVKSKDGGWFPATVTEKSTNEGVDIYTVEYSKLFVDQKTKLKKIMESVRKEQIRPPLPDIEGSWKGPELLDYVYVFFKGGWWKATVVKIMTYRIYGVEIFSDKQVRDFQLQELQIYKEWVNGAWVSQVEVQEEKVEASKKKASVAPKQRKKAETKKQKNTRTTNKNVLVTHQKRKVDETKKDDDLLVRAKKRKAAASPNLLQKYDDLPIDNLAFLLRNVRKKKRSPYQSPNNPLLCVTPPVHPVIDPFLTPDINKFKRMDDWLRKRGERVKIDGRPVLPSWFTFLENPKVSLSEQQIDATLSLFDLRRQNYETYFHKHHLPRAAFIELWFFNALSCSYERFLERETGRKFLGGLVEVVNGKKHPNKAWGTDVEVIYGLTFEKKSSHWIGMVINVKKQTITRISCGHPTEQADSVFTHVQHFAEMIPVLMCIATNKAITDNERAAYKVDKLEGNSIPKTNCAENCALFVLKMIECHSMGITDMSKLTDDTSDDIRSNLACDLFEELGGDIIPDSTPVRTFP